MKIIIVLSLLITAFIIGFFHPNLVATIKAPAFVIGCIAAAGALLIFGRKNR